MKTCAKCGGEGPFSKSKAARDGFQSWCKKCLAEASETYRLTHPEYQAERNARSTAYRLANPEKQARAQANSMLKARYGITLAQKEAMIEAQGGKCGCCGDPLEWGRGAKKPLLAHLDHNHTTEKLREILCNPCNLGLGNFRDDPKRLQAAIEYLAKHS